MKRNLGLVLARLLGWTRLMFLDDDIYGVSRDDVEALAAALEDHSVSALIPEYLPGQLRRLSRPSPRRRPPGCVRQRQRDRRQMRPGRAGLLPEHLQRRLVLLRRRGRQPQDRQGGRVARSETMILTTTRAGRARKSSATCWPRASTHAWTATRASGTSIPITGADLSRGAWSFTSEWRRRSATSTTGQGRGGQGESALSAPPKIN